MRHPWGMRYLQEVEKVRSMTKELVRMLSIYQHMLAHLEDESYRRNKKRLQQLKLPMKKRTK